MGYSTVRAVRAPLVHAPLHSMDRRHVVAKYADTNALNQQAHHQVQLPPLNGLCHVCAGVQGLACGAALIAAGIVGVAVRKAVTHYFKQQSYQSFQLPPAYTEEILPGVGHLKALFSDPTFFPRARAAMSGASNDPTTRHSTC